MAILLLVPKIWLVPQRNVQPCKEHTINFVNQAKNIVKMLHTKQTLDSLLNRKYESVCMGKYERIIPHLRFVWYDVVNVSWGCFGRGWPLHSCPHSLELFASPSPFHRLAHYTSVRVFCLMPFDSYNTTLSFSLSVEYCEYWRLSHPKYKNYTLYKGGCDLDWSGFRRIGAMTYY